MSFNINPLNYKEYEELTNKDPKNESVFWDFVQWEDYQTEHSLKMKTI